MEWNVSGTEFLAIYENYRNEITTLDVREVDEYQIYHLPNSILIPMDEIYCRIQEINRKKPVYIICEHGIRSIHVTMILYDLGFKNVFNVMGGFEKIIDYHGLIT